jgi:hypothetical protein
MLTENGESDLWGLTKWWICGVDVVILGALIDGEFLEFMIMGSRTWVDFSGFWKGRDDGWIFGVSNFGLWLNG